MKQLKTLLFYGGALSIKIDGYEGENGWGQFSFDGIQVDVVPHEESEGCSHVVDIPKTELVALRDFLNETLSRDQ